MSVGCTTRLLRLCALWLCLTLAGCNIPLAEPGIPFPPPATPLPTLPSLPGPLPTPPPPADSGWHPLADGLERRTIRLTDGLGLTLDELYLLRINPERYRFELGYRPGQPLTLRDWSTASGALVVVNAAFFTAEQVATGLIVVDGVASGWSYDFGGMVAIRDGRPAIRPLATQPYDPAEPLDDAFQTFPMLLLPGGQPAVLNASDRPARRTVIARDRAGRIVLLVAARSQFTLTGLRDYLAQSDLALDVALNLDGGTSSGLLLADPAEEVPAFVPLPAVLLVYPR